MTSGGVLSSFGVELEQMIGRFDTSGKVVDINPSPVAVCLESGQCLGFASVCEQCVSGEEIIKFVVCGKEVMIR